MQSFSQSYLLQGEKLKHTFQRLQDRVKVVLKESSYDAALADINSANSNLSRLREQLTALQNSNSRPCAQAPSSQRARQPTSTSTTTARSQTSSAIAAWSSSAKINRASRALHEALADAWSCGQASHLQHLIKLLVAADCKPGECGNDINMGLTILCPASSPHPHTASMLSLDVRTQNGDWLDVLPSPARQQERPAKRARVVRFVGEDESDEQRNSRASRYSRGPKTSSPQSCTEESCDLRCSKDICSALANRSHPAMAKAAGCLGHIDVRSDEHFRHSFYRSPRPLCNVSPGQNIIGDGNVVSLDKLLLCPRRSDGGLLLSMPDHLRLACQLSRAVLQYHATPWMPDVWRLSDLAFFYGVRPRRFRDEEEQIADAMCRTLHVGVEFNSKTGATRLQQLEAAPASPSTPTRIASPFFQMDVALPTPPQSSTGSSSHGSNAGSLCDAAALAWAEDDERLLLCGIDNPPLYCLGVALLQVDLWSDGATAAGLVPEDVVGVRKLAKTPRNLGPRYGEMVQKCLRCDFGYGYDLRSSQLMKAVYDNVVGPLESMLERMDIGAE